MRTESRTPVPPAPERFSLLARIENALALSFGVTGADRTDTVQGMLEHAPGWSAGYWLQLLIAMAIATLGLLLDSTAVVIGAMLVSPLMRPLVELGMGLAVGSPLLVIRSAARVVASLVVVVGSAAALTLVIPIHDVTREIAARTSPNLLDLVIASCCAIAAVYATIRAGSDTASTAAGTAIGIALVPPLCVAGYGVGTGDLAIAAGSALLFTANLCAILLFSALGFLVLGYGRVDVSAIEREHIASTDPQSISARAARTLSAFFASRLGPAIRIGMPVVLVAAVVVPLERALAEVRWEIRVRDAARDAVRDLAPRTVESSVRVDRHQVSIRVIAIGTEAHATALRARISDRVRIAAGVTPSIEVLAVPDASTLERAKVVVPERPAPPSSPAPATIDLGEVRATTARVLAAWPEDAAGPLLAWEIVVRRDGAIEVEVLHVGPALGSAAESILRTNLTSALHATARVRDVALPPSATVPGDPPGAWTKLVADAAPVLWGFPDASELALCVELPSSVDAPAGAHDLLADARVKTRHAEVFRYSWSTSGCGASSDGGLDANGAADGQSTP